MVTLRDVARAAGVSPATASRALSAPGRVGAERRERVHEAAARLGYRAHQGGAGRRIGVVVPDLTNPFFAGVVKAVGQRAHARGDVMLLADTGEDPQLEAQQVTALAGHADQLVLCSPRTDGPTLRTALTPRGPGDRAPRVVVVNRDDVGLRGVVVDNRDGATQALRHLHALGHRRVAYAGGPPQSWSDRERRHGLRTAAAAHGDVEVVDLGHFPGVAAGGVPAADLLVASGATAVVAHNDLIALGVVDRLRARGVDVPGQVSVVGFDDVPAATQVSPALTTVTVPLGVLGRTAVDLLDGGPEESVLVPVSLAVRASTGTVPGS
ncbi:LacI family transcriptional regulator [Cellulomonas bogoriensis 69B4 = DSM 16987]|uniref:LacI family transcriptional regulator n=1 Tax=Cellulomonas bogoriensis 69B4 = DSM 16987 TaxID=1386082 RepID=A0A0A0C0A1_9CELL|nr:LacI family transcriptional regulator [Cellulomonas bogoriensis 69B4 = DSM 16987]